MSNKIDRKNSVKFTEINNEKTLSCAHVDRGQKKFKVNCDCYVCDTKECEDKVQWWPPVSILTLFISDKKELEKINKYWKSTIRQTACPKCHEGLVLDTLDILKAELLKLNSSKDDHVDKAVGIFEQIIDDISELREDHKNFKIYTENELNLIKNIKNNNSNLNNNIVATV